MQNIRDNKGFTLVEVLAVVAIIAILAVAVTPLVSNYMQKGKDKYDDSLSDQFILAGKDFFSTFTNKLPKKKGESALVSLAELKALNIVKGDFIDSNNTKCSDEDSLVMVTNLGNNKYEYNACLICKGNDKFSNNGNCTIPRKCTIELKDDKYSVYSVDDGGLVGGYTDKYEAIKSFIKEPCVKPASCRINSVTINGIPEGYVYGDKGGVYKNIASAKAAGECTGSGSAECVYNNTKICDTNKYICAVSEENNYYSDSSTLIVALKEGITYLDNTKTYYIYKLEKDAFNTIAEEQNADVDPPSNITNATETTVDNYFRSVRSENSTLLSSSNPYVNKNKAIPAKYSFQIGTSSKKAEITNNTKMAWSDVEGWGTGYSDYATDGVVSLATSAAKGTYKARYFDVGSYNGKEVDLVLTLMDYDGCTLRSGAKKCGFWFDDKLIQIYSLGVHKLTVKYDFYEAGKNNSIKVKGYTTYWDIDSQQGIHFLTNTTGLYVYNGNLTRISNVNGAPYIYEYYDSLYSGYHNEAAVTETFEGSTMKKTFTFMSGKGTNYNAITSSNGMIYHSTIPIGVSMSYYNDNSNEFNSNSVLNKDSEVKYIVRFSNPTDTSQKVTVNIDLKNMEYVSGSAKFKDGTITNPEINSNTLTWSKTVDKLQTDYVIFTLKPKTNSCGKVASASATNTVNGIKYETSDLTNPVVCISVLKQECK